MAESRPQAKARALRLPLRRSLPCQEAHCCSSDAAQKVHYRRLAIARLRNKKAVKKLFDELVEQFQVATAATREFTNWPCPVSATPPIWRLLNLSRMPLRKRQRKRNLNQEGWQGVQENSNRINPAQEAQPDAEGSEGAAEEPASEPESREVSEPESQSGASDEDAETSAEEPASEPESKEESVPESQSDASDVDAETGSEEPAEDAAEEPASELNLGRPASKDEEQASKDGADSAGTVSSPSQAKT